jgi:hypothetical protein
VAVKMAEPVVEGFQAGATAAFVATVVPVPLK